MKVFLAIAALIPLLAFPNSSAACSAVSCLDKGVELRRDFVVRVTHASKPLQGVSVRITRSMEGSDHDFFSGLTAADGIVRVTDLLPGEYWLNAEMLGIVAGIQCFHVGSRTTRKAKKVVNYEWGDLAPATRKLAGRLTYSQPGQGGTPLWNLLHRVDAPIGSARLKLQNPLTGVAYESSSDIDGHFSFNLIPNGIYVLQIEKGTTAGGLNYESSNQLVQLSGTAKGDLLLLTWRDAGGGGCGGASLEVRNTPN